MFIIPVIRTEGVGDLTDLEKDSIVKTVPGKRFDSVLKEAVREADRVIKDIQIVDMKLASGQIDSLHIVLIQAEKIAAVVEFTTQITIKVVNAYNQIMSMQVQYWMKDVTTESWG